MTLNKTFLKQVKTETSFLESYLENPQNFIQAKNFHSDKKYNYLTNYFINSISACDGVPDTSYYDNYLIVKNNNFLSKTQKKFLSGIDKFFLEENEQIEDELFELSQYKHYCQIYYLDSIAVILVTNHIDFSATDSGFSKVNSKYFNDFCVRNQSFIELDLIKDFQLKEFIQNIKVLE